MTTVKDAKSLAKIAHGDQMYGNKPYMYHVERVVEVLSKYTTDPTYIIVAYLHDVVEDTGVTLDEIKQKFGTKIAKAVDGVTDEPGETRTIRKTNTLKKTSKNVISVAVKLADRIANVQEGGKKDMYRAEMISFYSVLYNKKHPKFIQDMWGSLFDLFK